MSSSFASVCPVRDDATTLIAQEQQFNQKESKHYQPSKVVSFLSHRLPSLSYSKRYRKEEDGNSNVTFTTTTSSIVHDWMQQNDRTSYAISVLSTWIIVSIILVVWVGLVSLVPKCRKYNHHQKKNVTPVVPESSPLIVARQQSDRLSPPSHSPTPSKLTLPPLSNPHIVLIPSDIVSSCNDDSLHVYSAEGHSNSSSERQLGATPCPQQEQQRCFIVDNDDIPRLQYLPATSIQATQWSPHHSHQHIQDISDLTGLSFQEHELSTPLGDPSESESTAQVDHTSLTASQYLSYCNQQSPKLMATSSREDSVSINLLEDSCSSSSTTSPEQFNPDVDNVSQDGDCEVLSQQDTDSATRDDNGCHHKESNSTIINPTSDSENFEDLRHVDLEYVTDAEVLIAESKDGESDKSSNPEAMVTTIKNLLLHHLPLPPGLMPTTEHDLSTIASASMEVSFLSQLMEEGLWFLQDEEDDKNTSVSTQGNPATPKSSNHQRIFNVPPTTSDTVRANSASYPQQANDVSDASYRLKHSHYTSDAASRKRRLEQYVIAIKAGNCDDESEGSKRPLGDERNVVEATNSTVNFNNIPFTRTAVASEVDEDPAEQELSGTPDTSPTSTDGADQEDVHFQFEDDEDDESVDAIKSNMTAANRPTQDDVDDDDRRRSRSPLHRTPCSTSGSWKRPRRKRIKFESLPNVVTTTQSFYRTFECRSNTRSWCCRDSRSLSIIVMGACACMIIATILFAINGVWTIRLVARDAGYYWGDLLEKAVGQLPVTLQQAQTAVLQRKDDHWYERPYVYFSKWLTGGFLCLVCLVQKHGIHGNHWTKAVPRSNQNFVLPPPKRLDRHHQR
jgi:hypothetical protein